MLFLQINRFLASLQPSSLEQLTPHLQSVSLPLRKTLYTADQRPDQVYFITSGLASVVTNLASGDALEVGLIGSEGFAAAHYLLGPLCSPSDCFMQVAGAGLQVKFSVLQDLMESNEDVRARVLEFVQYEALVLRQVAACSHFHDIDARLARWLLMVQDRVSHPSIALTQEFLGQMLGVTRPSVSQSATRLQARGLIRGMRGHLEILDRPGLELAACECYAAVKNYFDALYQSFCLEPDRYRLASQNHSSRNHDLEVLYRMFKVVTSAPSIRMRGEGVCYVANTSTPPKVARAATERGR